MSLQLYVPELCQKFIHEHPEEFKKFGCGPGGIGDYLVPDTVYFLDISPACRVHDWQYRFSPDASSAARKGHDKILSYNSMMIVRYYTTNQGLYLLRRRRIKTYYQMVRAFGSPSYWNEGRNEAKDLMEISKLL